MPDYKSDAGLLSHLQQQNASIDQFQAEAGATNGEVTSIKHDYANMLAVMNFCTLAEEYKMTAFAVKKMFLRGEIDESLGVFAAAPADTMPFTLAAGVEKRSRERDARFKLSPTMNEAARVALDLVDNGFSLVPGIITPTIELFAAQSGYEFAVVVSGRAESDMYEVQIRRLNQEKWTTVKSGTGKTVAVTVEPLEEGKAEKIEARVQLMKKNAKYGNASAPAYVTVAP